VHVPDEVNVRAIRKRHALTGVEFASRFGFSPGAVKEWEAGRPMPDRSARALLEIEEHEPESDKRALAA
jgi:putative transcriptional regulator